MKIKDVPQFDETITETYFALYHPEKQSYIQNMVNIYGNDTSDMYWDLSNDPKLIKNESTVVNWQLFYSSHNIKTEIVQIEITIKKTNVPKNDIMEDLLIIKKHLCRENTKISIDGGKLFEALSKEHARHLIFYMQQQDYTSSEKYSKSNEYLKEQIDFVKSIIGKKAKCYMIDLRSEVSSRAIFFFSDDSTSNALLKLVAEGKLEVYDTKEKKFL